MHFVFVTTLNLPSIILLNLFKMSVMIRIFLFCYLWPWVVRHRSHPPGPAAPRSDSDPSHWSVNLPTTVTDHQGRTYSWARQHGLCTRRLSLLCHHAQPRSVSPPHLIPQSTWLEVQQGRLRKRRVWRREIPGRGWRLSCPVGQKLDLSGGCSHVAAGHQLQIKRDTEHE